jgi:porin
MSVKSMCVSAVAMMSCAAGAWAGAPQPFDDALSLDWNGIRSEWLDKGVDFRIGAVSETATNVQGGDRELARYTDQITFSAMLDLEKLLGVPQATFRMAITDRNGGNLSKDANLQSLQQVQELYGRDQTWRWTQFWYQWPVSRWATEVKLTFQGLGYFQIGAFDVNSDYLQNKYSLDLWRPGNSSGVLVPVELGWLPTFGDGLKGSYKFGAWYNSSTAPDVVDNICGQAQAIHGGPSLMRHGQYGAYVNFLQQVTAPSGDRGLSLFFNATYADTRTSVQDNQIAAGLFYKGLFASRPADKLGFAIGRTHVNSRIADVETQLNGASLGSRCRARTFSAPACRAPSMSGNSSTAYTSPAGSTCALTSSTWLSQAVMPEIPTT